MNFNKIILAGRLTRDPEMTYLPTNQTPVTAFGIAVNRKWKGQDGQKKEDVMFIDCRIFGKQAETFKQYMSKGKAILIEGRLQLDRWEDQSGQKRSKHLIIVERFQFVGGDPQGQQGSQAASGGQNAAPAYQPPYNPPPAQQQQQAPAQQPTQQAYSPPPVQQPQQQSTAGSGYGQQPPLGVPDQQAQEPQNDNDNDIPF